MKPSQVKPSQATPNQGKPNQVKTSQAKPKQAAPNQDHKQGKIVPCVSQNHPGRWQTTIIDDIEALGLWTLLASAVYTARGADRSDEFDKVMT